MRSAWHTVKRSITTIKTASFIAALTASVLLPALANPSIAHATGGINNTRGDNWGTVEVPAGGSSFLGGAGVTIYSNGPQASYTPNKPNNTVNGVVSGEEWQCVELVNRLYLTKGWTTATWAGNGGQLYDNAPGSLTKELNGSITYLNPGDTLVLQDSGAGHAAIINTFNGTTGAIQIASQNTNVVYDSTFSLSNKTLSSTGWGTYSIKGVVHHSATTTISATATSSQITPDGVQHLFTGDSSGNVYDISWGNGAPLTQWRVASLGASVTAMSSQVVNGVINVYAAVGKTVQDIYWGNGTSLGSWQVGSFSSNVGTITSQVVSGVQHVYSSVGATLEDTFWGNGQSLTTWGVTTLSGPIVALTAQLISGVQQVDAATSTTVQNISWGNGQSLTVWGVDNVSGMTLTAVSSQMVAGVQHVYAGTTANTVRDISWGNGQSLTVWNPGTSLGGSVVGLSSQLISGVQQVDAITNSTAWNISWGNGSPLTQWSVSTNL